VNLADPRPLEGVGFPASDGSLETFPSPLFFPPIFRVSDGPYLLERRSLRETLAPPADLNFFAVSIPMILGHEQVILGALMDPYIYTSSSRINSSASELHAGECSLSLRLEPPRISRSCHWKRRYGTSPQLCLWVLPGCSKCRPFEDSPHAAPFLAIFPSIRSHH